MVKIVGVGKFGEDVAVLFLKNLRYRILSRNFILGRLGEIDIIARDRDGVLVFVEVKALDSFDGDFSPEDHFDEGKKYKLRKLADLFSNKFPEYIDVKLGCRVDLVAVSIFNSKRELSNWESCCSINHYKNVC